MTHRNDYVYRSYRKADVRQLNCTDDYADGVEVVEGALSNQDRSYHDFCTYCREFKCGRWKEGEPAGVPKLSSCPSSCGNIYFSLATFQLSTCQCQVI